MSNIKPNQLFQQAKPFHDGHSNTVEVTDIPLAL